MLVRISKVQDAGEGAKDKQNAIAQTLRQVAGQAEQYGCQLVRRPSESTALPGASAPL
jgi:hypothetical protein